MTIIFLSDYWLMVDVRGVKIHRDEKAREIVRLFIEDPLRVERAGDIRIKHYF